jgi:DHA2 family multidrug resistance protein
LPSHEQAGGSAIFNIMHNLGGSVGIAMLSFFVTEREHYHFFDYGRPVTQNSLALAHRRNDLAKSSVEVKNDFQMAEGA